jgi:kinesin family protein 5
MTDVICDLCV